MQVPFPNPRLCGVAFQGEDEERCKGVSGSLIIRSGGNRGFFGRAHFCARFRARKALHSRAWGPTAPRITSPIR